MGKFLVPRITTADRSGLTPDVGEIIFDTDLESYWGGDGSTAGGIPLGSGTGASWSDVTVTDANFTAANDTRYYLPAGVLTTDRVVNMGSITTKCCFVVAEDAFTFRLTYTGATIYINGGAETTDGVMGMATSIVEKVGSLLITI